MRTYPEQIRNVYWICLRYIMEIYYGMHSVIHIEQKLHERGTDKGRYLLNALIYPGFLKISTDIVSSSNNNHNNQEH